MSARRTTILRKKETNNALARLKTQSTTITVNERLVTPTGEQVAVRTAPDQRMNKRSRETGMGVSSSWWVVGVGGMSHDGIQNRVWKIEGGQDYRAGQKIPKNPTQIYVYQKWYSKFTKIWSTIFGIRIPACTTNNILLYLTLAC